MRICLLTVTLLIAVLLAGCADQAADPADTVERYLQAKVDGDAAALQELICAPMEADLQREASSFSSVTGVTIEDMQCQQAGDDIVQCTGQIVATYGTENTTFPLTSYRVVQEDGEWKWCGEAG